MTDRDSTTRTRARTPGEEDYPPSTAVHRRVTDPTLSGTLVDTMGCTKDGSKLMRGQRMPGAGLSRSSAGRERRVGRPPPKPPPCQPYGEKPAVRNDRGDRGDVGIIRSPVRASILPDRGGCAVMCIPTAILHPFRKSARSET